MHSGKCLLCVQSAGGGPVRAVMRGKRELMCKLWREDGKEKENSPTSQLKVGERARGGQCAGKKWRPSNGR